MTLSKFQVGETGLYRYFNGENKVFKDSKGEVKQYCDVHKRIQLYKNWEDLVYCKKCGVYTVPYIGDKK